MSRDDRLVRAQLGEHVDVLRALAGVEERDLRGRSAADEDALRAQQLPHRRVVGAERAGRPCRPSWPGRRRRRSRSPRGSRRGQGRVRCRRGGGPPGGGLGGQRRQLGDHVGVVAAADHERRRAGGPCARRRRRPPRRRRAGAVRSSPGMSAPANDARGVGCAVPTGHVLLERHVEVRAAEAEGAHARATADPGPEWVHSRSSVLTRNGVAAQSTFGLGSLKFRLGGEHLVVAGS